MPMYLYACPNCGWLRSDIRCIDQRHIAPTCDKCKEPMKLQITPVRGYVKNPAVPRS
jgi:predicted nucleic acid-binding Zn ribbon protein